MDSAASIPDERTNILVVDDLDEKLLVYRSILDEMDQNIVTAKSGEEALKHVLKSEFAVILLDVQMTGLDGFETASLIRKRRRSMHTPIIFLTAFNDDMRTAAGYAHGAVDYMSTPVVPEILRAKVRVFVDLFRMTQQVKRQAEARVALAEERFSPGPAPCSASRSITRSRPRTWRVWPFRCWPTRPSSSCSSPAPRTGPRFWPGPAPTKPFKPRKAAANR
jgi:CheY-like chemotaxis protein